MLKPLPFAKDATVTIVYIAAVSMLVAATLTLAVLFGLGVEFSDLHWNTTALTAAGWLALPFAPRVYRSLTGHGFLMSDPHGAQEF